MAPKIDKHQEPNFKLCSVNCLVKLSPSTALLFLLIMWKISTTSNERNLQLGLYKKTNPVGLYRRLRRRQQLIIEIKKAKFLRKKQLIGLMPIWPEET